VEMWWNSVHPDDRWMLEENDLKYKSGNLDSHLLEYRICHANGSIKWIRDRGVVIERTDEGMPVRIVGTHADITKEKEFLENHILLERQKKKEILQAMLNAQETERQTIAYELHENINQILSSCYVMLDWMSVNATFDKAKLVAVKKNINLVMDEIDVLSYSLSTSTLQLIGLSQALIELVAKINASGKLLVKLHKIDVKADQVKNPEINLAIFRITQEQIINIIKTSGAKHATIHAGIDKDKIFVEITDDRKDADNITDNKGIGLLNILNRAESLNGVIEFSSKPGNGFRLRVAIPINKVNY